MLQKTAFFIGIRILQRTHVLQRTILQQTKATKKQILSMESGYYNEHMCYNERSYNKRLLQKTVFISGIRILQRTHVLQQTLRNTIGRRSTRMRMTCRAFPLCLDRQSSSLLSFVRISYQFSSVICSFSPLAVLNKLILYYFLDLYFLFCFIFFLFLCLYRAFLIIKFLY
jgi:hypothetical protein